MKAGNDAANTGHHLAPHLDNTWTSVGFTFTSLQTSHFWDLLLPPSRQERGAMAGQGSRWQTVTE